MTTEQEFEQACLLLQACIGSLRCGVTIDRNAAFYADTLYRLAREYRESFRQSNCNSLKTKIQK